MASQVRAFGRAAMLGGALLVLSAACIDLGWYLQQARLSSVGYGVSVLAGLGLLGLPFGLLASGLGRGSVFATIGSVCLAGGTLIVSLVDVPAIADPTQTGAGAALGPLGLVLISLGFLAWFVALRRTRRVQGWQRWIFLVAGLWFVVTFPLVQLPLFVIPNGQPVFLLLSGVYGVLQLLMGWVVQTLPAAAQRTNDVAVTVDHGGTV